MEQQVFVGINHTTDSVVHGHCLACSNFPLQHVKVNWKLISEIRSLLIHCNCIIYSFNLNKPSSWFLKVIEEFSLHYGEILPHNVLDDLIGRVLF